MGILFSRGNTTPGGNYLDTPLPSENIDAERVGDVYLVIYSEKKLSSAKNNCLYTIVIDVAGESTGKTPAGLEIYISREPSNRSVVLSLERLSCHQRDKYQLHKHLGKIDNLYHQGRPVQWFDGLKEAISNQWLPEYLDSKGGSAAEWNHQNNSQQFAAFLIEKLKQNNPHPLDFPNDQYIAGTKTNDRFTPDSIIISKQTSISVG